MIRPMFGHRPKPRKFDMPLRYYNPEKEDKRRKRIQITTNYRKRDRTQKTRIFIYAFGLAVVVYVISVL